MSDVPNYCPVDGYEVVTDSSEIGTRVRCPACDDRWYPSPWIRVGWRLPPRVQSWSSSTNSARSVLEECRPSTASIVGVSLAGATSMIAVGVTVPAASLGWTAFGLGLIITWLTLTAAIPVHEWLHQRALAIVDVESVVEYDTLQLFGLPIGIRRGVTITQPYSWTGDAWEQALVALAPVPLILVGVTALITTNYIDPPLMLKSACIGLSAGLFYSGIPSESDLLVGFSSERYQLFGQASRSPAHRAAEGIDPVIA